MISIPVAGRWLAGLGLLLISGWVVHKSAPVLGALTAAVLIAYALEPAVSWLESRRVPRSVGTLLLALGLGLLLVVVFGITVPVVAEMAAGVAAQLDTEQFTQPERWPTWAQQFMTTHQAEISAFREQAEVWLRENAADLATSIGTGLRKAFSSVLGAVLMILNLIVVPILVFYILADWHQLRAALAHSIPPRWRRTILSIAGEIDLKLRQFMRGQLLVSVSMAVLYALGLGLMRVPLGVILGLVAGALNIVPYLGMAVGLIPALLLDFLQYRSWSRLLGILLVFVAVQSIEGWVLTPRLVGKAIGLHPVAVLLAVLMGGQLFGFAGVLLAVPATAVLSVLSRHLVASFGSDPGLEPNA
jgi:predicted PurR-regulated permease PerM